MDRRLSHWSVDLPPVLRTLPSTCLVLSSTQCYWLLRVLLTLVTHIISPFRGLSEARPTEHSRAMAGPEELLQSRAELVIHSDLEYRAQYIITETGTLPYTS